MEGIRYLYVAQKQFGSDIAADLDKEFMQKLRDLNQAQSVQQAAPRQARSQRIANALAMIAQGLNDGMNAYNRVMNTSRGNSYNNNRTNYSSTSYRSSGSGSSVSSSSGSKRASLSVSETNSLNQARKRYRTMENNIKNNYIYGTFAPKVLSASDKKEIRSIQSDMRALRKKWDNISNERGGNWRISQSSYENWNP